VFEEIPCYYCGSEERAPFIVAQDDLSGRPGDFQFVTCRRCGLRYQSPRLAIERVKDYYDDDYIAHRKRADGGLLARVYESVMGKHDRDKDAIVSRYVTLSPRSAVLDVGCAVGTFLGHLHRRYGASPVGVDFKDLSAHPLLKGIEFHCGTFPQAAVGEGRFDLVTMWHFLEHDYAPLESLAKARSALRPDGRLVVEVPRLDSATFRLFGRRWPGLQAPQHTLLLDKEMFLKLVEKAGFGVVDYLPYGAFPPYFYLFCGVVFTLLRGRGMNDLQPKLVLPYVAGQLALSPLLLFARHLNLAMQTVVCRPR
jgi:2-polyprenyl-3-methyl-5-hydroxy-6-metoxy-1,4-benzoquinol methylase